ncbi:MAG TPA: hypothetical protein VK453_25295 [Micromonosporaceae bacterium]|nr:hypothetical protein [Micromonosporaceae bacterium]
MGLFGDITTAAEALCDARENTEQRHGVDEDGKHLRPHRTIVPGLIEQLRQATEPGVDGGAGGEGGPESVPVVIDAVSLLASIEHGSRWRAIAWGVKGERRTAEDYIRGSVGVANSRPYDEQCLFAAELQSWQRQAEVITGWQTPSRHLNAPCPVVECGAMGSLLARVDPSKGPSATCIACGSRWVDTNEVNVLAEHVLRYHRSADARMRSARTRAVDERRRRDGSAARSAA